MKRLAATLAALVLLSPLAGCAPDTWESDKNAALAKANRVCGEQGARRIELHVHYGYVEVTCTDGTVRTVPVASTT